MGVVSALFIVLVTILCTYSSSVPHSPHLLTLNLTGPPVGVWMVAGCGADLLINICLTILG